MLMSQKPSWEESLSIHAAGMYLGQLTMNIGSVNEVHITPN